MERLEIGFWGPPPPFPFFALLFPSLDYFLTCNRPASWMQPFCWCRWIWIWRSERRRRRRTVVLFDILPKTLATRACVQFPAVAPPIGLRSEFPVFFSIVIKIANNFRLYSVDRFKLHSRCCQLRIASWTVVFVGYWRADRSGSSARLGACSPTAAF